MAKRSESPAGKTFTEIRNQEQRKRKRASTSFSEDEITFLNSLLYLIKSDVPLNVKELQKDPSFMKIVNKVGAMRRRLGNEDQ